MNQANALYKTYKEVCAKAIETFQDEPLDRGIELRQEYARKFLDYEDTGAHILRYFNGSDRLSRIQGFDAECTTGG
jgi:hypothetical protein